VEELIAARNYVAAITVLNFKRQGNKSDVKLAEWLAYAHFHHGEHDKVRRLNNCDAWSAAAQHTCRTHEWHLK
jgi:hypothetical protein